MGYIVFKIVEYTIVKDKGNKVVVVNGSFTSSKGNKKRDLLGSILLCYLDFEPFTVCPQVLSTGDFKDYVSCFFSF